MCSGRLSQALEIRENNQRPQFHIAFFMTTSVVEGEEDGVERDGPQPDEYY